MPTVRARTRRYTRNPPEQRAARRPARTFLRRRAREWVPRCRGGVWPRSAQSAESGGRDNIVSSLLIPYFCTYLSRGFWRRHGLYQFFFFHLTTIVFQGKEKRYIIIIQPRMRLVQHFAQSLDAVEQYITLANHRLCLCILKRRSVRFYDAMHTVNGGVQSPGGNKPR